MKKPVLVYTDDGRDVDDIEAITYIVGSDDLCIAGIVTTHMIPDRRAFIARAVMDHFNQKDVPIGVGSIFPIGKEDEALLKYLREHTIEGKTYEGEGMIECFPDGIELIHSLIDKHGKDLSITALAPMTDLAKAVQKDKKNFAKLGGLYIQGQAIVDNEILSPDPIAYNLKEDLEAANIVFDLQDQIPMTFIGKFAAYEVPLLRDDLNELAQTEHPVGIYIKRHAEKGLECFVRRAPEIFKRVFGIPPEQDAIEAFQTLEKLSNPYDALTVMALAKPELFTYQEVGHHKLIGATKENPGLKNPSEVKAELMNTMLRALRSR